MSAFLVTLHVIVAILLIGGILLQPGAKGGGLGAAFGGGGANSAFGARGAAPFLAKLTYWLAAGFMLTSLAIELKIIKENRSVLDKQKLNVAVPAAPAKNSTETVKQETNPVVDGKEEGKPANGGKPAPGVTKSQKVVEAAKPAPVAPVKSAVPVKAADPANEKPAKENKEQTPATSEEKN